ncbi:hypothetical protein METHP14_570005 [Pseudomonas sp. P14-2025]
MPVQHAATALAKGTLMFEQRCTVVHRVAILADDQILRLAHGLPAGSLGSGQEANRNGV